jgi:CelD/BcsL family acetyltransferase involved in cellulose biosynthesis
MWLHAPRAPQPHWTLRLGATFDDYLAKFNGDRRRKLRWAARNFDAKAGAPVTVERVTEAAQVGPYLARVRELSARTWQGERLGQVMSDDAGERGKLEAYARRGWLRSYLMSVGDQPAAFVLGWQAAGTYTYERIGYDPRWANLSPGNVLLFKLIEDLHAHQPARVVDFGAGDNAYKRLYGTDCADAQDLYLVRRSPKMAVARTLQLATVRGEALARRLVEKSGMKQRLGRWLKRGGKVAGAKTT